jgi:alanine racemase
LILIFMPRPLVATIHLDAMRHNLALVKARNPHAKVWAVIKANAYGHGLAHGMRGFAAADGLALIELDGAARLRELGWDKPILLLEGFFTADDLALVFAHRLDITVHCSEQIDMLASAQACAQPGAPLHVHLKMNTGMNRLGFVPAAFAAAHARLRALPCVGEITLMTHFANAEQADNPCLPLAEQMRRFQLGAANLAGARSLSNSAASLLYPDLASDWIRPGILLYGASPGGKSAAQFGLRPAMTLTSEIIGVQDIVAGEAIGYASRFVAERPMKVGVVACGYADGYPRHAPSGTPVIVDGVRTRLLGQVSMDMMTVDLTPVPTARVGSAVMLWGQDLSIDEVAAAAGTIGYELMCALAGRVQITVADDAAIVSDSH